jgi:competence protein ComEA
MLRNLVAAALALFAAAAFASVDANTATQAELESVKGIGPSLSGRIIEERKKAPFKDWPDMTARVKGVGESNGAKFSAGGLTVGGASLAGAPADKAAAKADGKTRARPAKETKGGAKSARPAASSAGAKG